MQSNSSDGDLTIEICRFIQQSGQTWDLSVFYRQIRGWDVGLRKKCWAFTHENYENWFDRLTFAGKS